MKMGRAAAWLLLAAGLAGAVQGRMRAEEAVRIARVEADELLYLPSGPYLKFLSLGQAPLLADLIYLWAIQYYGEYGRTDRYRYVQHIFGEVIAELDPRFVDAYWLGAMILNVEARDLEGGLRLLDLGFEKNPDAWILPYLAAWDCYRAGDFERAREYFRKAAAVPGAPALVRRMEIGMLARAGRLEEALRMWRRLLEDPGSDEMTRNVAERQIAYLENKRNLERLGEAVEAYRRRFGRPPPSLETLRRAGLLAEVPLAPDGRPYRYDPATGAVAPPGSLGSGR